MGKALLVAGQGSLYYLFLRRWTSLSLGEDGLGRQRNKRRKAKAKIKKKKKVGGLWEGRREREGRGDKEFV